MELKKKLEKKFKKTKFFFIYHLDILKNNHQLGSKNKIIKKKFRLLVHMMKTDMKF